jgi:CheY-like chemotaxis protein
VVAEGDEAQRAYIVEVLTEVGCRVLPTSKSKETISTLRLRRVDLLITDLIMPEQEGLEIILYVRKHFPNLKVIAISAGNPEYLKVARALGSCGILFKPFSAGDLVRAVECVCRHGLRPDGVTPGVERDQSSPGLTAPTQPSAEETDPQSEGRARRLERVGGE